MKNEFIINIENDLKNINKIEYFDIYCYINKSFFNIISK